MTLGYDCDLKQLRERFGISEAEVVFHNVVHDE